MIRLWIGTALLAGSWLLGLDYFYPANPWAWLAAVAAAVVLLGKTSKPLVGFAAPPAIRSLLLLAAAGRVVCPVALSGGPAVDRAWDWRPACCRFASAGPAGWPAGRWRPASSCSSRPWPWNCTPATRPVPRSAVGPLPDTAGRHRHSAGHRRHGRRFEHRDALDAAGTPARRHLGIAARSGHVAVLRRRADDAGLGCSVPTQMRGRPCACGSAWLRWRRGPWP